MQYNIQVTGQDKITVHIRYNGGTMKIQLAIAICENYIFNHQKHSGISYGNISNAKFRSGCNLGLDSTN